MLSRVTCYMNVTRPDLALVLGQEQVTDHWKVTPKGI